MRWVDGDERDLAGFADYWRVERSVEYGTTGARRVRFGVETFSNGLFVEITRLGDGMVVFVQGDDAAQVLDELERATDSVTNDEVVSNYFD